MDTPASTGAAKPAALPSGAGGAPPIVDDDVAAALASLGARATASVRITGLPSARSDRATFRVALDDGRVVKVRRLARVAKAERFVGIVRALAFDQLAPILAVERRICVEAWIEGVPLAGLPARPERIEAAADLLGALHATRTLRGRRVDGRRAADAVLRRAERQLGRLASAGILDSATAGELARALRRSAPARAATGLTHNDFCAENLVEDARGRLIAVDNEGLRFGFLDFDLARTWSRWPMPEADWAAFVTRYARWRDEPLDLAATTFWRIAAIVRSLHLRTTRRTARTDVPLRRLQELRARLG